MKSNEIKAQFKKLGIPVKVRTISQSLPNPWIGVRIPVDAARSNNHIFPESLRRAALSVVYGAEFAANQSSGGNIGTHSISLTQNQWAQLFTNRL